jgi:hypothetical protein
MSPRSRQTAQAGLTAAPSTAAASSSAAVVGTGVKWHRRRDRGQQATIPGVRRVTAGPQWRANTPPTHLPAALAAMLSSGSAAPADLPDSRSGQEIGRQPVM